VLAASMFVGILCQTIVASCFGQSLKTAAPRAVVLMYSYGSLVADQTSVLVLPLPGRMYGGPGLAAYMPVPSSYSFQLSRYTRFRVARACAAWFHALVNGRPPFRGRKSPGLRMF